MLTSRQIRIFLLPLLLFCQACTPKTTLPPSPVPAEPPAPAQQHQHHVERKIPTPLLQLPEPILDLFPVCELQENSQCSLLLLYRDRLELVDWKNNTKRKFAFPRNQEIAPSRAPAGKIVLKEQQFIVLHTEYRRPPCFTFAWEHCNPDLSTLPRPEPGLNYFTAGDGKFYDFELLQEGGIVVIETLRKLSIAQQGALHSAPEKVGGTFAVLWPAIYTSSPTLPAAPDQILKFVYDGSSLQRERAVSVSGELLDLCIADINRDQEIEMLATIRNEHGVFVEVMDAF